MDEVESFHFVMQATLSADQGPLSIELPMTSEGDFQRPDRSRASVDIDLGLFKIETEVIAIGDEVYMTDLESGQWIKSDGGSDLMILDPVDLTDPGEFTNQDNFSELDDLRIVGQEAIEGIDTHHLAFSLPDWESDEGEPLSGDIEMHMWVGVDDYYLYKITLDGRFSLAQDETTQSGGSLIAGLGSDGDIDLDAVVNLSNFNAPVLIQPPDDFRTELPTSPAVQDVAPVQTTELDSGWMRFDLPTKGVGISAPPTWLLVPLDVEDALGMVENSFADVEGLADLVESFGDEARHSLLAVELDDDGGLTSSFNIVTEAVDPALDLNALADFSVQQIELLLPGVGEVTSEAVELPAGAAYRIGYTVSASGPTDAAAEVAVLQYLLLHNSESIVVSFSTPAANIDAKSQVFQDIMDTLQLYDPGAPPSRSTNTVTDQKGPDQQMTKQYDSPPAMVIDTSKAYTATFMMEDGSEFEVGLFAQEAPNTVNNFVFLAKDGFYDGVTFHRVIPGFMAQGGDPTGTGRGGPGYRFNDEFHRSLRHDKPGMLSMANAGPNTNGSQFFITFVATPHLDDRHAVFGEVTVGMDVVNSISSRDPATARTPGDAIASITISES